MKFKQIIVRSLVPLNSLLLFLLIFDDWMVIPAWLKVFGRMHPLLLHFPIVLVLLYVAAVLFFPARLRQEPWLIRILDGLLITGALACSITALMGFFLYRNGGYDQDAIAPHKWTGALLPFLLQAIVIFRKSLNNKIAFGRVAVLITAGTIVMAGHYGSALTHGENFLLEPVMSSKQKQLPPIEEAVIYADLVQPILENKCMSCHNGKKAKGALVMDTPELLIKGGKNGKLWDTARADMGLMMHRIHLPLEEKKHMPPAGKQQLTDDETDILFNWIKAGANVKKRVAELAPEDSLFIIAKKILPSSADQQYDFASADEKKIRELNNNNRVIAAIAIGSPALQVNFYNSALFKPESLKELGSIGEQVVELNLENMPVTDDDLLLLKQFRNLRKLNLNFTGLTGKTLKELESLPALQSISLIGTRVDYSQVRVLQHFPKLSEAYLWNTAVNNKDIEELKRQDKRIAYHGGYSGDTVSLKLTPPMLKDDELVIDSSLVVRIKHNIPGTVIRFTIDGKDPDSLTSPVFKEAITLSSNVTLKAKAFKKGWLGSDIMKKYFFKRTFVPDSIILLKNPENEYRSSGAKTLYDGEKSDINFASGRWLGFGENPMEAILIFNKPVTVKNVTLSMLKDLSANIFAPQDIEIWAGETQGALKLVSKIKPLQPSVMEYRENLGLECDFSPIAVRFIKVIVHQLPKVPDWHQNKGSRTSVFVDEIFVN
ncbi:MAG: FN3 associated domain-containing protein [Flavitalea sp.]